MFAWSGVLVTSAAEPAKEADARLASDYAEHLRVTKGILDVRTIHRSKLGPNALDLVIVSAGFKADEKEKFLGHCEDMKETFFSYPTWRHYRDWVNFHTVFVEDESPANTRLKVAGYEGQILICDNGIAAEYGMVAADADATLVLHNSNFSTPACGMWGVTVYNIRDTKGSGSTIHELGHGLAGLGDEYIQQSVPFPGPPESLQDTVNVTGEPNPRLCKWHYWTVEEWPGLFAPMTYRGSSPIANFEGAGWPKGIYRPEEACMMRGGRDAFCAVCDETMQANIFRYAGMFEKVEPAGEELVLWQGESMDFKLAAIAPLREPSQRLMSRLDLYLGGKKLATSDRGVVSFTLDAAKIKPGDHQVGAVLNVQHEAIRRDFGFLSENRAWMVKVVPHTKPVLGVQKEIVVAPGGDVSVPVTLKHRNAGLFAMRMEHAPENAVLEGGRFKWRTGGQTGSWRVDFIVSHEGRDVVTESMEIHVDGKKGGIKVEPMERLAAVVGKPATVSLKAGSGGGGQLLFESEDLPQGAKLNHKSGEFTWTPSADQAGPHRIGFRVRNGKAVGKGELEVFVSRPGKPTPVSYSNSYTPDTLAALKQWNEGPLLYRRIFGNLGLLRDRYARIYEPALAEAEKMHAELTPPYRANVIELMSLHAWAFTDKPAVLSWMRRIAEEAGTADAKDLLAKLDLMERLEKIRKVETGSGREHLAATASALVKASDPVIQSAMEMAVKAICKRVNDDDACRQDLLVVLEKTRGPGKARLVPLVPLKRDPELLGKFAALAKDTDKQSARAAQQVLDYFNGLGKTGDFITSWMVSGPYMAGQGGSIFDEAFAPEEADGKAVWKTMRLQADANGVYAADFVPLFGGDQRAVYIKATLRSARAREILFAAGSDDGLKVWLNGELIHAKNAQRGVKPGEDQFRGRLKAGDNIVLCKVIQYTQGWGACMGLRSPDGGPALGVSVVDGGN